jgi:trans-2,3-dihydro-3-hydroxyanthranilate isomerase
MRFLLLDVFTDHPLTGNQLAVFPDGREVPEHLRQDLAREIGFSETVYCDPPSHPTAGDARVRIFTPAAELPFAGHPVLGTAVALGRERGVPGGSVVTLECGVGPVPVELGADGSSGWMRQPVPTVERWSDGAALLDALGLDADAPVAPIDVYDNGLRHVVCVVADPELVPRPDPSSSASPTSPARRAPRCAPSPAAVPSRPACSARASASPRTLRPVRRPDRSACTSCATASSSPACSSP